MLSTGRMNGFENIIRTIQNQVNYLTSSSRSADPLESQVQITDSKFSYVDEVAVLLSGGVDSSVALKLLLLQGYKVKAFYLKIWLEDEVAHLNQCPWEEDMFYAQSVCDQLNVTLETLSLQKEYWNEVVNYTITEARKGYTPNPDIMCNSRIKFGLFYDYIGKFYSKVATGHYAQVRPKFSMKKNLGHSTDSSHLFKSFSDNQIISEEVELVCSQDPVKDQTYFLCNLRQDQLLKALFPIGHLHKYQVRIHFNLNLRSFS